MKIYIDGHCDTLSETLDNNEKISNTQYCFNTIDAKQLAPVIQMSAVFINPKFENGFERANNIIDYYFKNMENTVIIKNKKDIQYVIEQKKIGIILGGGYIFASIILYICLTAQYAQYVDILLKVQIAYYIVIFVISILISRTLLNKRIGL